MGPTPIGKMRDLRLTFLSLLVLCGCKAIDTQTLVVGVDEGPLTILEIHDGGQKISEVERTDIFSAKYLANGSGDTLLGIQPGNIKMMKLESVGDSKLKGIADTRAEKSPTAVEITPQNHIVLSAHFTENTLSARVFDGDGFLEPQNFDCGWAHQFRAHPNGRWAYAACLKNTLMQFNIDNEVGRVEPMKIARLTLEGGPRHIEFHPNGETLYVMLELSSQVAVYGIDPKTGALNHPPRQIIATTTDGSKNRSSDLHITPDGKWLYAFNRKNQDMAMFKVGTLGDLDFQDVTPMKKGEVRHWAMDAEGRYLVTATNTGHVGAWLINQDTGALTLAGEHEGLGNATSVIILPK